MRRSMAIRLRKIWIFPRLMMGWKAWLLSPRRFRAQQLEASGQKCPPLPSKGIACPTRYAETEGAVTGELQRSRARFVANKAF